jgi:hypothetical protein
VIGQVLGGFAPAVDGVAVSLYLSRFPLVALLSPSIPPLYAMTASQEGRGGGWEGGCRLPGSIRWGRSTPDESWLYTDDTKDTNAYFRKDFSDNLSCFFQDKGFCI